MEQKFGYRRTVLYIINIIIPLFFQLIVILALLYGVYNFSEIGIVEKIIMIIAVAYIISKDLRWIIILFKITMDILTKNHEKHVVQIREIAQDKKYYAFCFIFTRRITREYTKNYTVRTRECQIYRLRMKGRVSPILDQISKAYDYKHHEITYLKHSKFIIDIKPVKEVD